MTPRRVYYINYIDPDTKFLKREEFDSHHDMEARIQELKNRGIIHFNRGSFETE